MAAINWHRLDSVRAARRPAEPPVADPDVDVVPARRCSCPRRRRTTMRCAGCGRPACFHCLTPAGAGGNCRWCRGEPATLRQRAGHALLALAGAVFALAVTAFVAWQLLAALLPSA